MFQLYARLIYNFEFEVRGMQNHDNAFFQLHPQNLSWICASFPLRSPFSLSEAPCQPEAGFHGRELSKHTAMNKLEDSGDRFGDYLRVNFNLP